MQEQNVQEAVPPPGIRMLDRKCVVCHNGMQYPVGIN